MSQLSGQYVTAVSAVFHSCLDSMSQLSGQYVTAVTKRALTVIQFIFSSRPTRASSQYNINMLGPLIGIGNPFMLQGRIHLLAT